MIRIIKNILEKNGKHLLTITFFGGFVVDYIFLPEISVPIYPYIGIFYIFLVGFGLLLKEWQLHLLSVGRGNRTFLKLSELGTSFAMGSLLSYVFIYYIRSGDIFTSWPISLFLLVCIFINEFSFQSSTRLIINTFFFYAAIVFFFIFNAPLVYKEVSTDVFVRGIIFSLLACYIYAGLLALSLYSRRLTSKIYLLAFITPVLVGLMYFTNILPAVPLTMREAGLYSFVSRSPDGNYNFSEINKASEKYFGINFKDYLYINKNQPVYFYTSVLAPAEVKSSITHIWQRKNQQLNRWENIEKVEYSIKGGRKDGYRGYTVLQNTSEGQWRVVVVVDKKRVVGQKMFEIKFEYPQ